MNALWLEWGQMEGKNVVIIGGGFAFTTLQKITSADNAIAIVCGLPIMIKFTQPVLEKVEFPLERMILSLEMRMKCGIGMCGRCNIG